MSEANPNSYYCYYCGHSVCVHDFPSYIQLLMRLSVPVVVMVVVLLYLHRRHGRKLMEEDAKGNYVSDDFGMQGGGRKGKTGPEMRLSGTEKNDHGRGISTDVMSPYILPPGLHGSRESFHSLSRSMKDPHDPYGQVVFGKGDGASINSERQSRHENGSVYTTSSGGTDKHAMNNGLLKNAQTMPRSQPPRGESRNVPEIKYPDANAIPLSPLNPFHGAGTFPGPPPPASALPQPASKRGGVEEMPSTYAAFTSMEPPTTNAHIPRIQSQAAVMHEKRDTSSYLSNSSYGDAFQVTPPSPHNSQILQGANPLAPQPLRPHNDAPNVGLGVSTPAFNPNRLSMSVRPLPPDDPSENQEERANRIRSFYKEYFDDSKPEPVGGHVYDEYYEDYGSEYLDGAIFDTESGAFVVVQPHSRDAAPVTRRAMTPPPRAPPRFRSNTGGGGVPRMSGQSSNSSSRNPPRNMSSMSGRPPPPKKPLPAPTPLASLPTPAKLTENAMMFDPNDFAPPISYRDRQAGRRPDSPLGESRPYSPAVRAHTPLVGSYDDLAAMPSP
jgi:hypothetical protein